jgi:ElaB/YqjD/DUF883 family membrane-anchored ribosome-binding protein
MKNNGHETATPQVVERAAAMAHEAVDKAAEAAAPATDWLTSRCDALVAREKKLVVDSRDYVATHPLKAVGFAVLAGFVLSRLFR